MMLRLLLSNRHGTRAADTELERYAPLLRRGLRRALQALTLLLLALGAWLLGPDGAAAAAGRADRPSLGALGHHAPPGTFAARRALPGAAPASSLGLRHGARA